MTTNSQTAGSAGDKNTTSTPKQQRIKVTSSGSDRNIRVRTKRLDQIDGDKIALAYWLLAKKIVENGSDVRVTDEEARRVASEVDDSISPAGGSPSPKNGGHS